MAEFLENVTEHSPQLQDIEGLPPSVNIYQYNGMSDFNQRLSFEHSRSFHPGVVFFMIEPSDFERDFSDCSIRLAFHVRIYFNAETKTLAIKIPHPILEHAIRLMDTTLKDLSKPMGLAKAVLFWGAGRLRDSLGSAKEADAGWGPLRPSPDAPRRRRPPVVLEVAWSETNAKLRRDCQYWVDPQRGQADLAIGVNIYRQERKISISKWGWNHDATRPRANETSTLEITKRGGQIHFMPDNSAPQLTIPFHTLFRRDPQHPRERDITLDTQELIEFAQGIWDAMEFLSDSS